MSCRHFWPLTTDCLVLQLNVYFTAQAVYKAFEGLFGGVKVLPGAFCLLRYTAVESLMAEYSLLPSDDDIQAANELELGEDRFMTCLFLEHGWDVLYEPDAKAGQSILSCNCMGLRCRDMALLAVTSATAADVTASKSLGHRMLQCQLPWHQECERLKCPCAHSLPCYWEFLSGLHSHHRPMFLVTQPSYLSFTCMLAAE